MQIDVYAVRDLGFIIYTFRYTGPLRRYKVTPKRDVPSHIKRPDYHKSGQPMSEIKVQGSKYIPVYDDDEIEGIRLASKIGRVSIHIFSCVTIFYVFRSHLTQHTRQPK